jgi:hypothetical protein
MVKVTTPSPTADSPGEHRTPWIEFILVTKFKMSLVVEYPRFHKVVVTINVDFVVFSRNVQPQHNCSTILSGN